MNKEQQTSQVRVSQLRERESEIPSWFRRAFRRSVLQRRTSNTGVVYRRDWNQRALQIVLPLLTFTSILWVWEIAVERYDVRRIVLPAPSDIWRVIVENPETFREASGVTIQHALVGLVLATIVGCGLAILMHVCRPLKWALQPVAAAMQAIPVVAIAPALVMWFGILSPNAKYLTVMFIAVFPFLFATLAGLASASRENLDVLDSLGAGAWQKLKLAELPAAVAYIASALRVGIGLSVVGAVVAEWSGSIDGLGGLIQTAKQQGASAHVWACVAVLAVIVMSGNAIAIWVETTLLRRYRPESRNE